MKRKVLRVLPWMVLFVLVVLAAKQCGEFMDDTALAAVEPDPSTMKPCPGRKVFKQNGRKYYWYCGTGVDRQGGVGTHLGMAAVDERPAQGRTEVGASCGRAVASGHR